VDGAESVVGSSFRMNFLDQCGYPMVPVASGSKRNRI
jgi:hypothetical protein